MQEELTLIFTTLQEDVAAIIGSYFLDYKDVSKITPVCAKKILAHAIPIIQKALFKELEEKVFYVDTRGYIALKPNATKNWQALKGE